MSETISIVINVDTRPGWDQDLSQQSTMMNGTRSFDFMSEGVRNKVKAFKDFETEVTLFVDVHEPLTQEAMFVLDHMMNVEKILDNLVINRHNEGFLGQDYFPKFNDLNFLNAMIMSRGKYLVHFDGDMNIFLPNSDFIKKHLKMLDDGTYDYISYPSPWSPDAVHDPDFQDYMWASTRFFMCKRSIIDYSEILACLVDSDYMYDKYGDKKRRCPWLEHVLGIMAGKGRVFYPPFDAAEALIFSWSRYMSGTLSKLNAVTYAQVLAFVTQNGGVQYPCDVRCS